MPVHSYYNGGDGAHLAVTGKTNRVQVVGSGDFLEVTNVGTAYAYGRLGDAKVQVLDRAGIVFPPGQMRQLPFLSSARDGLWLAAICHGTDTTDLTIVAASGVL